MNLKVKNRLPYCVGNLFSAIHLSTVSNFTPKSQSKMEQQEGAPENNSDDVQEVQVPVEIVAENEDIEDLDAELAKLTPEEYEAKKQNAIEDIKQLEEDFQTWVQLRKDTIEQLKSIADYVEKVFRRAGRTKIASTGASVMAGGVTIVGGVMTIASAGAALPVLVAGASMALASGVAGGTAAVSEKVIKSKEMKKAQKTVALDMDQAKELEQALRDTRKNIVAKEIIREVLLSSGWSSFNGYQVISVMGAGLGFTSATGHAIMSVSGETLGIQFSKLALANSGRLLAGTITIVVGGALMAYDIYQLAEGIKGFAKMGPDGAADIRQIASELERQLEIITPKSTEQATEKSPISIDTTE